MTGPDCTEIPKDIRLAIYVNKYPYSTLHPEQFSYATTSGLSLAWRDFQIEDLMAQCYLDRHGKDTTATQLYRMAEENSAVSLLQRKMVSEREPTLAELQKFYEKTSATLIEPASSQLHYYFLRRVNDTLTSLPLVKLLAQIEDNCETEADFFQRASGGGLPRGVTTGSATVQRGKLNMEIEDQAFSLPLNKPSLFSGEHGWYIFCVTERQDTADLLSFDETSHTLRSQYYSVRLAEEKQQVEQYVKRAYPVSYQDGNLEASGYPDGENNVFAKVGDAPVTIGEFNAFVRENRGDLPPKNSAVLHNLIEDYLLRVGLMQLAVEEGYTSGCEYRLIRDFDFNKALAANWLIEALTVPEPTEFEIRQLYNQFGPEMEIGPQYGVLDIWTTIPVAGNSNAPDKAFLQRETALKRMHTLRSVLAADGLNTSLLPALAKEYGPFVIQDHGIAPQGPRGYLLDTAVEKLSVNEFSPVVQDKTSVHFYMLNKLIPARQMTFEEASSRLAKTIRSKKRAAAREKLIESFTAKVDPIPDGTTKLLNKNFRDRLTEKLKS